MSPCISSTEVEKRQIHTEDVSVCLPPLLAQLQRCLRRHEVSLAPSFLCSLVAASKRGRRSRRRLQLRPHKSIKIKNVGVGINRLLLTTLIENLYCF